MQTTSDEAPRERDTNGAANQQPQTDPQASHEGHAWLSTLMRELFQTERSAKEHPIVEAERLGDVPPARAMRAVSAHAESVLADLPRLARTHGLPESHGGEAVGKAFSIMRDAFADLLLSVERSYRGTLLGMRHGIDVVETIRLVAQDEEEEELATWCSRWLEHRRPLVDAVAEELGWFAANPECATAPAKSGPLASGVQAIVKGFEGIAEKIRHEGAHQN
jgi:hypothetical protein